MTHAIIPLTLHGTPESSKSNNMSTTTGARQAPKASKNIVGIVVSAGKMNKTVKVRVTDTVFNKRVQKLFATHKDHLVHDPSSSARLGDVVTIQSGFRVSTQVHHLLRSIVSPMGEGIEERPTIPSVGELLRKRKEDRTRRDAKLLGVADAVSRLRILEEGQTEGMDEKDIAEELRQLREVDGVQDGVRKGLNGALMRLKEAGKMRWREHRATLSVATADSIRAELQQEAQQWERRCEEWYDEAHSIASRGRSKAFREEREWRALFSSNIAIATRKRITEVDAYLKQIEVFASNSTRAMEGLTTEEAERAFQWLQDQVLRLLCEHLASERGVYKAEVENLKAEGNWLYSLEWLKDPANPWRWQSHQIQLSGQGRLSAEQIASLFRSDKGRNSPVWYAAMREGLKIVDPAIINDPQIPQLVKAFETRKRMMDELEAAENSRKKELKERIEMMKRRR